MPVQRVVAGGEGAGVAGSQGGAGGSAAKPAGYTSDDIAKMSREDFQKLQQRVIAGEKIAFL